MSIVVAGATGNLGRLIVEALLRDGVDPAEIVAGGRATEKLADLEAQGVRVAKLDYSDRATLDAAFAGAKTLVFVSGSEVGKRVPQHTAVIDAAKAAGVGRVIYTSAPAATSTELVIAPEHATTEQYLEASGVPFTILRNGWYTENYVFPARDAIEKGVLSAAVGEGRVASASRADYADAVAVVVLGEGHEGKIYELSGDTAWNFEELAATISDISGTQVAYVPISSDERRAQLLAWGWEELRVGFTVILDGNIRDGLLAVTTGELSRLIGRPTTPLREGLAAALK